MEHTEVLPGRPGSYGNEKWLYTPLSSKTTTSSPDIL